MQWGTGMHLFAYPPFFMCVGLVLSTGFVLVRLGHSLLGLLRDFDDYRANRPKRDEDR
jgi:hypothetical protein